MLAETLARLRWLENILHENELHPLYQYETEEHAEWNELELYTHFSGDPAWVPIEQYPERTRDCRDVRMVTFRRPKPYVRIFTDQELLNNDWLADRYSRRIYAILDSRKLNPFYRYEDVNIRLSSHELRSVPIFLLVKTYERDHSVLPDGDHRTLNTDLEDTDGYTINGRTLTLHYRRIDFRKLRRTSLA